MGKFRQCLTELSACNTIMAGYNSLTFLFIDRFIAVLLWFTISVIERLCMYALVKFLFWIAVRPIFGRKLSFWISACTVLIVVSLLLVRTSFDLVSWTECVR